MKDPQRLIQIQDQVFSDRAFWPTEQDGKEITYCNLTSLAVAEAYGCFDLSGPVGHDPLTADQMYARMAENHRFLQKPIGDCQDLVNQGALIFAALPSAKLGQSHGHICTLTPGVMDYSGHWDAKTPVCMNIGRSGTCFRLKGVNYAFQPMPEFFAWAPTL